MSASAKRLRGVTTEVDAEGVAEHTGGRPPLLDIGADPLDWATRGKVARELGVHVSTIRRLEASGDLNPRIGDGGIRYFSYREVWNLKDRRAKKTPGRAAEMRLAAFELFAQGVLWPDVALRLRYDPLRIQHLWQLFSMGRRMNTNATEADSHDRTLNGADRARLGRGMNRP